MSYPADGSLESVLHAQADLARAQLALKAASVHFLNRSGYTVAAPGWNGHGRLAMTTDEAVAFELKRLAVGTGCHGYGGKCPRPVTVLRGKLRLCAQCDADPPDPNPLPRVRDPEGEARAKLRVRDYDDPHNEVARNAPH